MSQSTSILAIVPWVCSLGLGAAAALGVSAFGPILSMALDRSLGGQGLRLQSLGVDPMRVQAGLAAWCGTSIAICLLLGPWLKAWPVAAVVAGLMFVLPKWFISVRIRRRERLMRDQLASACFGMSCAVKAGLSLAQAIDRQAQEVAWPLSNEFRQIAEDYRRGQPLGLALETARERLMIECFSLFVMVLRAALERGGNLDQALNRIAGNIYETQRIERKLESETASGRHTIHSLSAFPLVFLGGYYLLDPGAVSYLFETIEGQFFLSAVILLVVAALAWATAILNQAIEV